MEGNKERKRKLQAATRQRRHDILKKIKLAPSSEDSDDGEIVGPIKVASNTESSHGVEVPVPQSGSLSLSEVSCKPVGSEEGSESSGMTLSTSSDDDCVVAKNLSKMPASALVAI
ncbi:hypothetical protein QAD02_017158 [Eretmocerus hayati]|uniref:Uncharacterized protein n=1 Tax=Eretmocerus hayati TaxID=131215 RepID=A0ACC2PEY5_9HYME|nr:hypothetical protein QAD02_017158 [Eretmocerus hayati]